MKFSRLLILLPVLARLTLCRPTFWEYRVEGFMGANAYYSGKWRYADAAASK